MKAKRFPLCECGCGKQVNKLESRFISGHNSRGRHHSDEAKEKIRRARIGTHRSEKTKAKMRGKNNPMYGKYYTSPMYGKHHTKEAKKKIKKKMYGKHHTEEAKRKMRGRCCSKETKRKIGKASKKRWQNPEFREKCLRAWLISTSIKPTKPEKGLRKELNKLFPNEYKYVGDGSILIAGRNPDFINVNDQKKIVELFGDYWHSKQCTGRTRKQEESQRIKHFAEYGYETLIVWECELNNIPRLRNKLIQFHGTSY